MRISHWVTKYVKYIMIQCISYDSKKGTKRKIMMIGVELSKIGNLIF